MHRTTTSSSSDAERRLLASARKLACAADHGLAAEGDTDGAHSVNDGIRIRCRIVLVEACIADVLLGARVQVQNRRLFANRTGPVHRPLVPVRRLYAGVRGALRTFRSRPAGLTR